MRWYPIQTFRYTVHIFKCVCACFGITSHQKYMYICSLYRYLLTYTLFVYLTLLNLALSLSSHTLLNGFCIYAIQLYCITCINWLLFYHINCNLSMDSRNHQVYESSNKYFIKKWEFNFYFIQVLFYKSNQCWHCGEAIIPQIVIFHIFCVCVVLGSMNSLYIYINNNYYGNWSR